MNFSESFLTRLENIIIVDFIVKAEKVFFVMKVVLRDCCPSHSCVKGSFCFTKKFQEDIMSKELAKTYDPKGLEDRLYKKWLDNGYFHAKVNPDKKPFTIVMPPPNVTGQLHMGHALDETMQDILIRFKRMQGYEALWQPGTDHAAIATEVKVIDKLKKEGIDKDDIGREEFLKHAWEWKEEYGGKNHQPAEKTGCFCRLGQRTFHYGRRMFQSCTGSIYPFI